MQCIMTAAKEAKQVREMRNKIANQPKWWFKKEEHMEKTRCKLKSALRVKRKSSSCVKLFTSDDKCSISTSSDTSDTSNSSSRLISTTSIPSDGTPHLKE